MLIIARRRGQRILIGHDIEIIVTDISRNNVKVGVTAPASCTILRGEIHEAIEEANRAAILSSLGEAASPQAANKTAPVIVQRRTRRTEPSDPARLDAQADSR